MSPDTGMSYQSRPTRQNDGSIGRGRWHGEPWKPVEMLAMVLGFIVYWPIGFAVLGWKFWQKKSGYSSDIISFGREKWGETVSKLGVLCGTTLLASLRLGESNVVLFECSVHDGRPHLEHEVCSSR